ncbi:molybdopterin converting factor subunit 1 [Alkalicoccobacillus plakortidis]|uniref:Molybdopterin synthase sulfur carrier subunit n=1 Tax=Alkalicoccobacillus plakortidis TaxID=444060 RepID=A0ABT0XGC8_9BACI|nr:molybdopterin converting factor subunit 1 [Alkalicoccobacillus plakortidis]MCM2674942.1 molybdopterin converting factor subunit 1 [Alkalicoccobacillus plakortidis]
MITVKCFASLEEKIGTHILELSYSEKTVKELVDELQKTYQIELDSVMVAVNEEYAEQETIVRAGDTLALIPPVSGG